MGPSSPRNQSGTGSFLFGWAASRISPGWQSNTSQIRASVSNRMPFTLPALLLVACSSVVPSTLAMLATTSPIKADPQAIAVALVLPPGIAVMPNTAELKIGIARADTGEQRSGRYILIDAKVTPPNISLAVGETLHVFRLGPKDADDLRRLQAELAVWEAEVPKGDGSGSLSLGLAGCAVDGGPAKDAVASAYIRTKADGPFLPLIDRNPLAKLLESDISTAIKPCP